MVINENVVLVVQRVWDGARDHGEWIDTSGGYWVKDDNRKHVEAAVEEIAAEQREIFGTDNVRIVRRTTTTVEEVV